MEINSNEQTTPVSPTATPSVCSFCHQPISPQYYFCPNCGTKLNIAPLSTTIQTQAWIYLFSLLLPMICFIFVNKWPGIKYFKSKDPKAKQIGYIAWTLLILSTIGLIWFGIVLTQELTKSTINSINTDFDF